MFATSVGAVYGAFVIYGIAMAAVNIGWTMGPIYFAGRNDSAAYMGAHVALVGVRGVIGGPLGMFIYRSAGTPRATFAAATALFLTGSILMASLHRSGDGAPGLPGSGPISGGTLAFPGPVQIKTLN